MNLLFIFTGGTIGSTVSGDYITTDENKPYELLEAYRNKYGFEHTYNAITPYTELSEQNTGVTISKLIRCVCDAVSGSYDGIIITHGTDTLPYSAAALSYALGNDCIPVCFVSSNYPITDKRANGVDNLYGAIKLIEDAISFRGVFVSYRNHDGIIYIHRASRLLETQAFSDEYYSANGMYYGKITKGAFIKNPDYTEKEDGMNPLGCVELPDVCEGIKRYHLFPGIKLDNMDDNSEQVSQDNGHNNSEGEMPSDNMPRYILLESYHSGTMNTKLPAYRNFFEKMYEQGITVFLCGVTDGITYESTSVYGELHIQSIYGLSPVAAYMKLWMIMSAGYKVRADELMCPLGGDRDNTGR